MKNRLAVAAVAFTAACAQRAPSPTAPIPSTAPTTASTAAASPAPTAPPAVSQGSPMLSAPAATSRGKSADSIKIQQADVSRRAVEVFGDSSRAAAPVDSGPSWDIDVESYASTARVEHYVRMFTGPAKERIASRLSRGTRYEPMIRAKLREGGLPEDMYYLALIESGFDPNAYSRAAAVGMWQFMTSTGRDMGLRIDWWVDERRDPFKSTTAAVRFIKGLNEQFGSLYLAAAAYNGGPGRVSRGLTRYAGDLEGTSGDDLFFALADKDYFRNETREYVPQLIAAALIAKEPARYSMQFETLPPVTFDSVRVGPATPMAAVARAADVSVADVLELNTQILRGITPPKDSFFVRVPSGKAAGFDSTYAALPKSERMGIRAVVSKKGENVAIIARREGLNSRQLSLYNPKLKLVKGGNLAPGQTLLVPTAAVASAAVYVPDPGIERYSSSRATTTHVVKSGETLGGIAKKYHTTTASLMRSNSLKRPLIFSGQSLVVVGKAPAAKAAKPSKVAKASAAKPAKASSGKTKVSATKAPATKKGAGKRGAL